MLMLLAAWHDRPAAAAVLAAGQCVWHYTGSHPAKPDEQHAAAAAAGGAAEGRLHRLLTALHPVSIA